MCGRALGGHMRAHGIGDENYSLDNDDTWEEKFVGSDYRTKSEGEDDDGRQSGGWGKRKRSLRVKSGSILSANYPSSEELEDIHVARCLLQLSNARVNPPMAEPSTTFAPEEEKERRNLILEREKGALSSGPKSMFECKACKKVFNSHQALGGHRAGHKKVKGCYYATKQEQTDEISLAQDNNIGTPHDEEALLIFPSKPTSSFQFEQGHPLLGAKKRKSNKVHECSICGRVFSSGQALGGHKSDRMKVGNKVDEELADNKLKLAKLINELEDIENKGNSSQWLQVGIGSTNHV
ncbi:hypothetical protein DH2020_045537 [Rehmannia glutinosa]|uniref:C2H2-type domain-containing protein n=1 Tax=Rehmannia glutinosa TaxID=99300 RepID=A0ABR0UEL4_REHGL